MNTEPPDNNQQQLPEGSEPKSDKSIFVVIGVIVGFVLALYLGAHWMKGLQVVQEGVKVPDFTLADTTKADGQKTSLSDFKGKVVLVHVFASWCPTCKDEIPSLKQLDKKYRDRGLVILALSWDDSVAKTREFMRAYEMTFPALWDAGNKIGRQFGTTQIPETYLIDRNGILVRKFISSQDWQEPRVEGVVLKALDSAPAR